MGAGDREYVLDMAKLIVTKDRNSAYGEPEDNFTNIANIWSAQGVNINGRPLHPHDVALMMAGMKLARLKHDPNNEDSWIDVIGYLACGFDTAKRLKQDTDAAAVDDGFVQMMREINEKIRSKGTDKVSGDVQEIKINGQPVEPDTTYIRHPGWIEHQPEGWVGDYRCGIIVHHSAHCYDTTVTDDHNSAIIFRGNNKGAMWCDGWQTPALTNGAKLVRLRVVTDAPKEDRDGDDNKED